LPKPIKSVIPDISIGNPGLLFLFKRDFVPASDPLLFRQKDPNPLSPVRVSSGALRRKAEFVGCETRGVYPEPFDELRTGLAEGLKQSSPSFRIQPRGSAAPKAGILEKVSIMILPDQLIVCILVRKNQRCF